MNIAGIAQNKCLWAAVLSWAIAQCLKIVLVYLKEDRFDATRIIGSGGMPSSHSSLTMALSTSIGKYYGFDSAYFAIALIYAVVVMYDAAGVRRAAGKQAEMINYFMTHHHQGAERKEKLKELLGHTPLEVFAGAFLGIGVGLLF
ncbi:MAG: divergent PAP2 family protein [Bacillota bacterium]